MGGDRGVLEGFVPFEREVSVIVGRGVAGEVLLTLPRALASANLVQNDDDPDTFRVEMGWGEQLDLDPAGDRVGEHHHRCNVLWWMGNHTTPSAA